MRFGTVRRVLRYLLHRAAWGIVTLVVFATVAFFLVNLVLPYDFATQFQFGNPSRGIVAREQLGLDRPLLVQFADYLTGLVTLDLGTSFTGQPVSELLFDQALPITLLVFVLGSVLAYLLGSWLGRRVGWHPGGRRSAAVILTSVVLYSTFPPFLAFVLRRVTRDPLRSVGRELGVPVNTRIMWTRSDWDPGTVFLVVGAGLFVTVAVVGLGRWWLRTHGWPTWPAWLTVPLTLGASVALWHATGMSMEGYDVMFGQPTVEGGNVIVGVVAFLLLAFGETLLVMDTTMAVERTEAYVTTARAKGVSERAIRDHHVARNAVLPVLSRFAVSLPLLLTGLVILERELALPGLSSVFFTAVENVDTPLILGCVVVFGAMTMLVRLGLETAHAVLDPRLRQELGG